MRRGLGHLERELETNPAAFAHGGLAHVRVCTLVTSFPCNASSIVPFLINMSLWKKYDGALLPGLLTKKYIFKRVTANVLLSKTKDILNSQRKE